MQGKHNNNASLLSPSINMSYRAGFLNETRLSMQSSVMKAGETQKMLGGSRVLSGTRNT